MARIQRPAGRFPAAYTFRAAAITADLLERGPIGALTGGETNESYTDYVGGSNDDLDDHVLRARALH